MALEPARFCAIFPNVDKGGSELRLVEKSPETWTRNCALALLGRRRIRAVRGVSARYHGPSGSMQPRALAHGRAAYSNLLSALAWSIRVQERKWLYSLFDIDQCCCGLLDDPTVKASSAASLQSNNGGRADPSSILSALYPNGGLDLGETPGGSMEPSCRMIQASISTSLTL